MLDAIILKNKNEIWLIYTDRIPFILYSERNVLELLEIFVVVKQPEVIEDTQVIEQWPMAA